MSSKQKAFFILIIFLAIFFRFYLINQMPGGLFPDEAANGLDINSMQKGQLQPFYERGNGREALFFYMEWGSVALFGKGPWQHHIVSALIGVLSVIVCYFLTQRIFLLNVPEEDDSGKKRARNIALTAAFLMAVNSYYVVVSRTAFRANLIPLLCSLTFLFFLGAYQAITLRTKLWFSFLTGVAFAGGFYTYISFRIMPFILFMLIIWPLFTTFKLKTFTNTIKNYRLLLFTSIIGFAICIYPIAHYFITHPGSFIGRSGQVSVFNPDQYLVDGQQLHGKPPLRVVVAAIGAVTKKSLLAYFTQGDLNWRQNVSGYPFLSPIVSPFFAVGLVAVIVLGLLYFFSPIKKASYYKYYLLMGWFFGMLIPEISTAESIPHGLRALGTVPVIFIVSAWVMYETYQLVLKIHTKIYSQVTGKFVSEKYAVGAFRFRAIIRLFQITIVLGALALILQTYFLYFVLAYNSPENFYAFRSDLTTVSDYINTSCEQGLLSKDHTYLVLDKFSVQTTDYITSDRYGNFSSACNVPYNQVDPEDSWKLSGLQHGDLVIFTQSSIFDIKKFKHYHPNADLITEYRNKFGQAVLGVYKIQ